MNTKHKRTLEALYALPTRANIIFSDIETLVIALGGKIREGAGSRLVFDINGQCQYLHRPHPGKEAKKYQVEVIRQFFQSIEVAP